MTNGGLVRERLSMPPTVVSPTLLHQTYGSEMVLESAEASQSNMCNPLQWIYMPMGHSNDVPHSVRGAQLLEF